MGARAWCGMALLLAGCQCPSPVSQAQAAPAAPKCVPKILVAHKGTPVIDGELDEPVWHSAAATEAFVDKGSRKVVPHTEARAAWDAEAMYLVLYVADADLRSTDHVTVRLANGLVIEATPNGKVRCGGGDCEASGVIAKFEVDGDVDADKEEDEEWAVELKVPWKVLASEGRPQRVDVGFSRDETLDGKRLTEVWSRGCGAISVE
jgi:hypothetical protein